MACFNALRPKSVSKMACSENRENRYLPNWIEKFETCLNRKTSSLTPDRKDLLPTSDDVPALLCALATYDFKANTGKLEILSRLCNILLDSPDSREEFLASGGLPIIVQYVTVNSEDVESQIVAYRIMAVIAGHNPTPVDAFVQCEVLDVMVDSAKKFHQNEKFLRAAILLFKSLSSDDNLRKYLQTPNVILSLLEILKSILSEEFRLLSDPLYVAALTSILSSLVFQSQLCRSIIAENHVVKTLLKAMADHASVEEVQYSCLLAIQNALYQSPISVACFLNSQGLEMTFSSMATHPGSMRVLKHGLGAILNAVMINNDAKRNVIEKKDFLGQICKLECGDNDLEVIKPQISIWFQLCEYDAHSERTGVSNVAQSFDETESIAIISKYLRVAHEKNNVEMFMELCHLQGLLFLATCFRHPKDKNAVEILKEEIEVIVEALESFREVEKLTIPMLELLGSLLSGQDDCKIKFNELSGVINIVSVMKQNRRDVNVNLACCKVLDIAAEGQLAMSVMLHGKEAVRGAILTCMADFIDNANLTDCVCSLLIKMAVNSKKDASELAQAGARNMVQMAQVKHKGNPAVESLANQLLVLLEDPGADGRPGQPSGPRGTAGQRMRSRSRTVEDPGSVRARANKSKSPVRAGQGRGTRTLRETRGQSVRMLRKGGDDATEEKTVGGGNSAQGNDVSSRIRVRRAARQKLALEPVYEI